MDACLVPSAAKPGACRCGRRAFVRHCMATCLCASTFRITAEPLEQEPLEAGLTRARREFEALVLAARALDFDRRIAFINVEVNQRIEYAADPESVPGADVWSTPCETLARGAGDCEDFAITKFFLLLASGYPQHGVRLLYAHFRRIDLQAAPVPHMVALARWPLVDPLVMDSINPLLIALSRRDDLHPIFSFDQSTVWQRIDAVPMSPERRTIRPWRTTLARTGQQLH
ncbi:transglutaminase-like cysteine peptidase [Methylibium sp. Pch-M]|uniref:transglutaminase-like cysteine peptidase n=1 Tax=Methylibium sp. Pch-M TaxID=2082386 RepID=UPI0013EDA57B|nr:transglutaminase-like cysteine peptidase [Methylibium sp. Pch-M]